MDAKKIIAGFEQIQRERQQRQAAKRAADEARQRETVAVLDEWMRETLVPNLSATAADIKAMGYPVDVVTSTGKESLHGDEYESLITQVELKVDNHKSGLPASGEAILRFLGNPHDDTIMVSRKTDKAGMMGDTSRFQIENLNDEAITDEVERFLGDVFST